MARRRHRRRSFRGIASLNLSGLPVLGDNVAVADVLVGVAIGFVGSAAVKAGLKKFAPSIWAQIESNAGIAVPAVTGIGAAAAVYMLEKKAMPSMSRHASGHAAGAALAGVVLSGWEFLKRQAPQYFNESVALNLSGLGGYGGLLVRDNTQDAMNGLLVRDQVSGFGGMLVADRSDNLAQLAAYSMGDHDDGGLMDLAGIG